MAAEFSAEFSGVMWTGNAACGGLCGSPEDYPCSAFAGKAMDSGVHIFQFEIQEFISAQSGAGLLGVADASSVTFGEDGLPDAAANKELQDIGPHWGLAENGEVYKKDKVGIKPIMTFNNGAMNQLLIMVGQNWI